MYVCVFVYSNGWPVKDLCYYQKNIIYEYIYIDGNEITRMHWNVSLYILMYDKTTLNEAIIWTNVDKVYYAISRHLT